ncbi:Sua5/YciO/YrdC/YwlC family protein, partial [Komagataeibacter kakiaceti]|uniref:Sua5/YciO/YrdC/YwlC family protein n=1 Tax=Komagataeibacter kakiaceti TaxID=943261 RepID=UPI0004725B33
MSAPSAGVGEEAELIRVSGVVQGVGFRPFVWRVAHRLGLRGSVRNRGDGVEIVVAGPAAARAIFVQEIRQGPERAVVRDVARQRTILPEATGFVIADSAPGEISTGIVADLATCPACRVETPHTGARRAGYVFTNCTDCGPRFSIVTGLPYDRPHTTMAGFSMCTACRAEYDDPANRRFHAQPIACPTCGPRLRFVVAGEERAEGALDAAVTVLLMGGIIALKGIGGYHLACLATSDEAVRTLRTRKARPAKPLAVMMGNAAMVTDFCTPTEMELALLHDPAAPVVPLGLRGKMGGKPALSAGLAPGLDRVGVMLAYTPLHDLLLERVGLPLVMTSGNRSGCLQVIDEAGAYRDLADIADGWLVHDRPIARRLDDSVMAVCAGAGRVIRRGRGLAP